jgi:Sec-independent protein translocase protein TatA
MQTLTLRKSMFIILAAIAVLLVGCSEIGKAFKEADSGNRRVSDNESNRRQKEQEEKERQAGLERQRKREAEQARERERRAEE